MITENTNTPVNENNTGNNMSQTLFRFVSLRNPQLTETNESNKGFIFRKADALSLFSDIIPENWSPSDKSKITLLEEKALEIEAQYPDYFYKNETEINNEFSQFATIAKNIAKNQLDNVIQDINLVGENVLATTYKTASNPLPSGLDKLWDNLIYQVLFQNEFYVKEAIINFIKVYHFAENTSENLENLRNAKVVLPVELFSDNYTKDGNINSDYAKILTVNRSAISSDYIALDPSYNQISDSAKRRLATYAEKNTEIALAQSEKNRLESLKAELELVNKNYQRLYNSAYNEAHTSYNLQVKPLLDDYEARLKVVRDTFNTSQTPEEKQALLDAVAEPVIPEFNFEFPALDTEYLKTKLTVESYSTLSDVLQREYVGNVNASILDTIENQTTEMPSMLESVESITPSARILPVEEVHSYDAVAQIISSQYSNYNNTVLNSTSVATEQYANVGGTFVPVQTPAKYPFTAVLTPKQNYRFTGSVYDFDIALEMPDASWEIESMDCEVQKTDGASLKYSPKEFKKDGVKILVQNIFNDQFSLSALNNITDFSAKIYFKNGKDAQISFALKVPVTQNHFSVIELIEESNTLTATSDSTTPSGNTFTPTSPKSFVPKGFGIRRLGIADYLKVEQSVHAYVPGEVSNIENVMASELRHKSSSRTVTSEVTDSTRISTEKEHVSDTTVATRNEMQSEISKMKLDVTDIGVSTSSKFKFLGELTLNTNFAHHKSKEESTRQSVTKAQEVTNKALDRIVSKVEQERIQKIINTYTEMNVHEFDNRGKVTATTDSAEARPQHITGVYRWVDKKMKNQIYNYGKRLMFEFMIPQPAKLHENAVSSLYTAPVDPRKSNKYKIENFSEIDRDAVDYWCNVFGIEKVELPKENVLHVQNDVLDINQQGVQDDNVSVESNITFDATNYIPQNAKITYSYSREGQAGLGHGTITLGNISKDILQAVSINNDVLNFDSFSGVSFNKLFFFGGNIIKLSLKTEINYMLDPSYIENWRRNSFEKIILAYEKALTDYEKKVKDAKSADSDNNTGLLREIEQNILKHNAIAYMVNHETFGAQLYTGKTMKEFAVLRGKNLDDYASLVKFMEQAFEWEEISYEFYPYYWGSKEDWPSLYQSSSDDAQFRAFLQSGMARVVATVRPGFEDAVTFYMSTGKIWNGGEVPVIGDPMYLSVVDEMKEPTGTPQGKYWITRVPTSLTILQAKSVGLNVNENEALPVFPETDVANCENPEELVFESKFTLLEEDVQLQGNSNPSTLFNYAESLVNLQNNQG